MSPRRKSPVQTVTTEPHFCSIDLRLKILGRLPFFDGVTGAALEEINKLFVEVGCQPGEVLYHAGDPAARLYVVAEGKIKLMQHTADGRSVLLDLLASGDFFGPLALSGPAVYAETAQAQTAGCMLRIALDDFRALLAEHPELALKALAVMAERLAASHQRVLQLSAMPVEQRIAFTLLRLAEKLGREQDGGILIDTPLSRDDLADMTGTTPETVSRVISRLQAGGAVTSGRQWLAVTDRTKLRQIAENSA